MKAPPPPHPVAERLQEEKGRDFPGGPVAKTPCSQCRKLQVQSLVRELDLAMPQLTPRTVQ